MFFLFFQGYPTVFQCDKWYSMGPLRPSSVFLWGSRTFPPLSSVLQFLVRPHGLSNPSGVQEELFAGTFWPGFVQTPAAAAAVRPEVRQVPGRECCLPTEGKLTEECMAFWTDTLRASPDEDSSVGPTAASFVPLTECGLIAFHIHISPRRPLGGGGGDFL